MKAALLRFNAYGLRHTVCAEHQRGARRHIGEILDKHRTLGAQVIHHIFVVDNFVAHINRRAMKFQRPLDDLDGAIHAGAKAARIGQQDVHFSHVIHFINSKWGAAFQAFCSETPLWCWCFAKLMFACRMAATS